MGGAFLDASGFRELVRDPAVHEQVEGYREFEDSLENGAMQVNMEEESSSVREPQVGQRLDAQVGPLVVDSTIQEEGQSALMEPVLERPLDAAAEKESRTELDGTNERSTRGNYEDMGEAVDSSWGANGLDYQGVEIGRRRLLAEKNGWNGCC